jgi:hypothetical protein
LTGCLDWQQAATKKTSLDQGLSGLTPQPLFYELAVGVNGIFAVIFSSFSA